MCTVPAVGCKKAMQKDMQGGDSRLKPILIHFQLKYVEVVFVCFERFEPYLSFIHVSLTLSSLESL